MVNIIPAACPHCGGDISEKAIIEAALKKTGGHVGEAATIIGVGQATLYRKIEKLFAHHEDRRRRKDEIGSDGFWRR